MADIPVVNRHNHSMGVGPYHTRGMPVAPASSACQMLAAAVKFRLLACLLTVLATVLSVRTTVRDHALAAWVSALVRLGHDCVPFAPRLPIRRSEHKHNRSVLPLGHPSRLSLKAKHTTPMFRPEKVSDSGPDDAGMCALLHRSRVG
jgi:hypothetical protein